MPKLSVVMSVYNEPVEWMCQSIDSILNQTFSDFEFIIINDKPDRVENKQLLDEYASKDPRIVIITNEQNIGLTKSLNKGLDIAAGEYIVRIDADDISLPERFEKQVRFMDANPNVVASGTGVFFINENSEIINRCQALTDSIAIRSLLLFQTAITHPSAIIRKEIGGKKVCYNEHFRYAQDYALWASLVNYDLSNIKEPLLKYRLTQNQISSSHKKEQDGYALEIKKDIIGALDLPFSIKDYEIIMDGFSSCSGANNKEPEELVESLRFVVSKAKNISNTKIDSNRILLFIAYRLIETLNGKCGFMKSLLLVHRVFGTVLPLAFYRTIFKLKIKNLCHLR